MTSTPSSQGDRGSREVGVPTAPERLIGSETSGKRRGSRAVSGSDEAGVPSHPGCPPTSAPAFPRPSSQPLQQGLFLNSWLHVDRLPMASEGLNTQRLHGDLTSLAPHERLPEILVVPREKTPTGAAARGNP